jgi:hypothetical protein
MADCVNHRYDLLSYKDHWDKLKKKYGCSDAELREEVRAELQLYAWADIFEGVDVRLYGLKQIGAIGKVKP